MSKVIVLGAKGMLGNAVYRYISNLKGTQCLGTDIKPQENDNLLQFKVSDDFIQPLEELIQINQPDYLINCIGIIRPGNQPEDISQTYLINSYFPQISSRLCKKYKVRFIHISTDCVFSGTKGNYSDDEVPDNTTVYGMSKYLGETDSPPSITLRTSLIGREIGPNHRNLLDWFLDTDTDIEGYSRVYWNGITTLTLVKIIGRIIENKLEFSKSLIQLGSERISKYELLKIFRDVYQKQVNIIKNETITNDKTLKQSLIQDKYFSDLITPLKNQIEELELFYRDSENSSR